MTAEEHMSTCVAFDSAAWAYLYRGLVPLHRPRNPHHLLARPHLEELRHLPQGVVHHFPVNIFKFLGKKDSKAVEVGFCEVSVDPIADVAVHISSDFWFGQQTH
jgi:hypothetical protein